MEKIVNPLPGCCFDGKLHASARHLAFAICIVVAMNFATGSLLAAREQERQEQEPIEVTIAPKMATIEISNPQSQPLALYSSGLQGIEKLLDLPEAGTEVTIRVPIGKYAILDTTNSRFFPAPVPERTDDLEGVHVTVHITDIPESAQEGWTYIPAGAALLGDEIGVGSPDEGKVTVEHFPAFWLGRSEVTNSQYCEFLNDQPAIDDSWIDLRSRKCLIRNEATEPEARPVYVPDNSQELKAASMPVVMVSYHGATAYCEWLTRKTGTTHRLPHEKEWEKAARGPFSFVYSYGNRYQPERANQESGTLREVGAYGSTGYGLCDMTGNVFEWMSNRYDPADETRVMNQALRGGSFVLDGMYQRNSFRMRQSPDVMTDDFGFRVLREIEPEKK